MMMIRTLLAAAFLSLLTAASPPETRIAVTLPPGWSSDAAGRLLVFAAPATAENAKAEVIETSEFEQQPASVAARDVTNFGAERAATIDTGEIAYPASFATLAPGDYRVQAVLDRNGDYNYNGRGAGDLVSKVVTIHWPLAAPATIALDHALPEQDMWDVSKSSQIVQQQVADVKPNLRDSPFTSAVLSAFWGRPITIPVWVLTPPGYDPRGKQTYPTVYMTDGFGSTHAYQLRRAAQMYSLMKKGLTPPMIYVFLDHSAIGTGTTEFADSVNNGPWGKALTTELMPSLERDFRMDAKPSGRFLQGHSSGGWSTLWLQVRYPKLFGGAWPTSPDPSDFHDFTGADLYAPNANFYHDAAGHDRPLIRKDGKVQATILQFAKLEAVLGHDGGQFRSFDWVFSPRERDGMPMPMFDRDSGAVDPEVVAYWRDHYDVAHLIETHAKGIKPDLDGKVHLTVGTADTFYLDGAAHRLDAVMQKVGIKADFTYLPGKTHGDLYERNGDRLALTKDIAWAMIAVARPGTKRPPTP